MFHRSRQVDEGATPPHAVERGGVNLGWTVFKWFHLLEQRLVVSSFPMRVSKKTDYALRALFTLVDQAGRGPVPIRELSRRNDIPKKFLEQIMLSLKERGWVTSLPGIRGGYMLAKAPDKITMGEVVRHFDGILAPIGCVSATCYERCSQEPLCRFRRVFLDVRNYVATLMDQATLADVSKGTPVTKPEVFVPGFAGGEGI